VTALATPAWAETPPAPAPGDLVIDPATMPEDRHHLIPRFADPVWPVTFTSSNPSAAELRLHWATFPDGLREQFRLAAWALLNFPVPDRALALRGAAMRPRLSTLRLYQTVANWRTFATWLDGRGITGLAQASTQVLTDYSIYLARTRKVSRNTAINHLVALTRLHAYGPHLPGEARIGVPAWDSEGLDDYLPAATAAGENATEPISPATMGPLLVWALKFTEEFAADILAAHEEERRLRQVIEGHLAQPASRGAQPPALTAYLEDLQAHGKPLPAQPAARGPGAHGVATQYIAAVLGCDPREVQRELRKEHWRRYLAEHPGGCPLDVPVTGRIDGEPWTEGIAFGQAGSMARHLVTACFVVVAYLTGMRSTEVLALEAGCCPDPSGTEVRSSEARRHLIRARQFKTARDHDGNHLSAGVMREVPWIAVPQVVTAIRVLERLAGPSGLLFPTDRGGRPGRSLAFSTMGGRIEDLISWVNERTARPGREDTIPADPHGHIGTSRFRRTLAWHIARRPGGLVALAVQYGHLRTVVSQGYGSRQRDGIHQLLDLETARSVAEHLSEVHDALRHGEGVSGPAARRLIHAAREEHHCFGGLVATPRQAKALLSDPALTVFENADAYLTCNYDPRRALCNPDNAAGGTASAPSLDRCQATCPNIARTDIHAGQLRAKAERLRRQADTALTPHPVADRLRQRAATLAELADNHDRTRIALTDEEPA
jgi:hypothetical protein